MLVQRFIHSQKLWICDHCHNEDDKKCDYDEKSESDEDTDEDDDEDDDKDDYDEDTDEDDDEDDDKDDYDEDVNDDVNDCKGREGGMQQLQHCNKALFIPPLQIHNAQSPQWKLIILQEMML